MDMNVTGWDWLWMSAMMTFWVVLVVALVLVFARGLGLASRLDRPEDILARRFARGEMDRDEYLQTLDLLEVDAASKHRPVRSEPGSARSGQVPATGLLSATEPASAHWNIVGLTCPADATRLERELGHIPGVISVVVNPLTERADIRFNASVVSELELRGGVERSGFGLE